jgi:hypothetical protein
MNYKFFSLLVIFSGLMGSSLLNSQIISIPAAGNSWVINDVSGKSKIITGKGIENWADTMTVIRTWFRIDQKSRLNINLIAKVKSGISLIQSEFDGVRKNIRIENVTFDTIPIGSFNVTDTGYKFLELKGISRSGQFFAEIPGIILTISNAGEKVYYVKDDFHFGRRGPSVHLKYNTQQDSDIEWFYNEITVPEGNDIQGSYFMANGFADGYFGIQVNSPTERRILFSVWSPYKTDNPGEIPDEYKIILLKKGKDVITKEFGNEGSGGQSYRKFFWKAGNTYRFILRGSPSVNNSTDYTAWFFAPETGKWELIASFRRPKTNNHLRNLYSFLENFIPETGFIKRMGYFSNQWVCDTKGKWTEVTNAKFTADATAKKESRLDYSGGVENGMFFLMNCGFFNKNTPLNTVFSRPASCKKPDINFSELE